MATQNNNIYFFTGGEDLLISQEIRFLTKSFAEGTAKADCLTPDDSDMDEVIQNLCSASLFDPKRVVVLREFDEEDLERLFDVAERLPDTTCVIIVKSKADKRTKFYKLAAGKAKIKEFASFTERDTPALLEWIRTRFLSSGQTIDDDTAMLLSRISGTGLNALSNEIEKISLYAGDRSAISENDVISLAVGGELGNFAMENAIDSRDINSALSSLAKALKAKERPEIILSRIYSRIRTFLSIRSQLESGGDKYSITRSTGMNPYYFDRVKASCVLYSSKELAEAVDKIADTDIALKTTQQDTQTLLELLLVGIIGNRHEAGK